MDRTSDKPDWNHPAFQALFAPRNDSRILLPVGTVTEANIMLPVAEAIVARSGGQLTVLYVMPVPEERPMSQIASQVSDSRLKIEAYLAEASAIAADSKLAVRVAREVWDGIWETVEQEKTDILLLGWQSDTLKKTAVKHISHQRLASPPCNVVVVRPGQEITDRASWKRVDRILLTLKGGRKSSLALRVANALALESKAKITLLHVAEQAVQRTDRQALATFAAAMPRFPHFVRSITTSGPLDETLLREAQDYPLIVMGAPERDVKGDGWSGSPLDQVVEGYRGTLVVVKRRFTPTMTEETPSDATSVDKPERQRRPFEIVVDKWFAENTFRSEEFEDIERLVALKEKQGLTISLGLPALNEEETVGSVIGAVKRALMDSTPLLDEIVLIDSGSQDKTRQIAEDLDVPVYVHHEILPQYGGYHGKGEALWKSLYVLRGKIVAWIDTDIKNIHPRFVYGILGPLLKEPRIKYVKGFYQRPLTEGEKLVAGGGGRVTELTARPLINLFFPELSGLIQPLSGEYAGRKDALARLPFFTGYGVETGLLVDLLEWYGLEAIAQVDLRRRIHHNQPLPSLSKMANAITQVVIRRLEDRHRIKLLEDVNKTMNLIRFQENHFSLDPQDVKVRERPPMASIPEYQQKFGTTAPQAQEAS